MLTIELLDREQHLLCSAEQADEVFLYVDRLYQEGDFFRIRGARHLWVQMDPCIPAGEVYLPKSTMTWSIPFGEHRLAYHPLAFTGNIHVISAREMPQDETLHGRWISRNPSDLRGDTDFYPHCTANVETRGESCFAARNLIDGFLLNTNHGFYPYQSWGIGTRTDAFCEIDLGRPVFMEKLSLVLRADFPHDAWWESAEAVLDDKFAFTIHLKKTGERQVTSWESPFYIQKVKIRNLKKAEDPSPFPSLTQLEIFGRDAD